jgi:hypothetical protein
MNYKAKQSQCSESVNEDRFGTRGRDEGESVVARLSSKDERRVQEGKKSLGRREHD